MAGQQAAWIARRDHKAGAARVASRPRGSVGVSRNEFQGPPPEHSAMELLGDGRMAVIHHEGRRYLLRLTRQNKLLLTKDESAPTPSPAEHSGDASSDDASSGDASSSEESGEGQGGAT